jgi:hypothetical protein
MDRVEEILIAIVADTGLLVGRDVRRIKSSERHPESQAAGIFLAALSGVANHAIGRVREIGAALDEACLRELDRNAGGIGAAIIRKRHFRAVRKCHRTRTAHDPKACRERNRHDRGNPDGNASHGCAHARFPAAIMPRSTGSRRRATPVAA